MISIIDYGMGNLRSAQKGLEKAGFDAEITADRDKIMKADGVILPGVGAFKDCYEGLEELKLVDVVKDAALSGKPFLGICVGLQLLFESSEENEGSKGLGLIKGKCVRFPDAHKTGLKVPHMGWNTLESRTTQKTSLLKYCTPEPYVYFVHSYYAVPEDDDVVLATSNYGIEFAAMVGRDNMFAVQFHPEKSQTEGISILRAFGELVEVEK